MTLVVAALALIVRSPPRFRLPEIVVAPAEMPERLSVSASVSVPAPVLIVVVLPNGIGVLLTTLSLENEALLPAVSMLPARTSVLPDQTLLAPKRSVRGPSLISVLSVPPSTIGVLTIRSA